MAESDLDYAKTTGRFALTVGDTDDVGDNPDILYCDEGTVEFAPLIVFTKVAGGTPAPFEAGNSVIVAQISGLDYVDPTDAGCDGPGWITYLGKPFVYVVDLTSTKVNPRISNTDQATHSVTFKNVKADGTRVNFPARNVRLTAAGPDGDGINDLVRLLPLVTGSATPIFQGPQGVSVVDAAITGGTNLELELSDGTSVDAGTLPSGPGGSDPGVAGYLASISSATSAAAAAAAAAPAHPLAAALSALSAVRARQLVGSVPLYIQDDFRRSDRNLHLDSGPSGPRYTVLRGGGNNELHIINGRMSRLHHDWVGSTNIPILLAPCAENPTYLAAAFVCDPGTGTLANDAVIGPCRKSYADASVQLSIQPDGWRLFVYPDDGSHTQTEIESGDFTAPLIQDGATEYTAQMWYDAATSTVTALFPSGPTSYQLRSWTDPLFAQAWGNQAGFQTRRFSATDGEMHFTRIAVGPPPRPPMPVRVPDGSTPALYLPGDVKSMVQSTPITVANLDDFDVVGKSALEDWSSNGLTSPNNIQQGLLSVWRSYSNERSLEVHVTRSRKLTVVTSADGTNTTYAATSATLPATDGDFLDWRIRRRANVAGSTVTDFYTSPDGGTTWTLLSTKTTAGITHVKAPTEIPLIAGAIGENPVTNYPMRGKLAGVRLYTGDYTAGGTLVAALDNTTVWSQYQGTPGIYTDAAGNAWVPVGTGTTWRWTNETLPTLPPQEAGTTVGLYFPGLADTFVSTPAPEAWFPTGNLDLRTKIAAEDYTSGALEALLNQYVAGARAWSFHISSTGALALSTSADGTLVDTATCSVILPTTDGADIWVRVTRQIDTPSAGLTRYKFYTSHDGTTWSQIGATSDRTWTSQSIYVPLDGGVPTPNLGAPILVGARGTSGNGHDSPFRGRIYSAEVRDGVAGTVIAALDNTSPWEGYDGLPQVYTDSAGNVWSKSGRGAEWLFIPPSGVAISGTPTLGSVPIGDGAGGAAWGSLAFGPGFCSTLGNVAPLAHAGTVTTGQVASANDAIAAPIIPDRSIAVTKLVWFCTTSSGNYDIGIYDDAGTALWRKGSTAMPAAGAVTVSGITGVTLQRGVRYWIRLAVDTTTARFRSQSLAIAAEAQQLDGNHYARFSSSMLPLPASQAISSSGSTVIPLVVVRAD